MGRLIAVKFDSAAKKRARPESTHTIVHHFLLGAGILPFSRRRLVQNPRLLLLKFSRSKSSTLRALYPLEWRGLRINSIRLKFASRWHHLTVVAPLVDGTRTVDHQTCQTICRENGRSVNQREKERWKGGAKCHYLLILIRWLSRCHKYGPNQQVGAAVRQWPSFIATTAIFTRIYLRPRWLAALKSARSKLLNFVENFIQILFI